jgi:hypothetical protein
MERRITPSGVGTPAKQMPTSFEDVEAAERFMGLADISMQFDRCMGASSL